MAKKWIIIAVVVIALMAVVAVITKKKTTVYSEPNGDRYIDPDQPWLGMY